MTASAQSGHGEQARRSRGVAGVSVATALKALNGQGRMTAETRQRIR
jgi:LacI family transcriptional regulator